MFLIHFCICILHHTPAVSPVVLCVVVVLYLICWPTLVSRPLCDNVLISSTRLYFDVRYHEIKQFKSDQKLERGKCLLYYTGMVKRLHSRDSMC